MRNKTLGKGHIADTSERVASDLLVRHVGRLLGGASPLPERLDYTYLLDGILDQGPTSSCVGHAFANSVYLRAKTAGTPMVRPSARAIYDFARMVEAPNSELQDIGSMPSLAVLGMQQFGLVANDRWPLNPSHINEPPPLDVFEHAIDATVGDYYRIPRGAGCSDLIRQALAKGYFPAFAMDVDDNYERLLPDEIYDGPTGPSLGGHMQCIVGYAPGWFLIAGSWGYSFARNGFARISEGFFERGLASDILVPTLVPKAVT